MPRNPNSSYEKIALYLKAIGKPCTINDIVAAGIVGRNTAYRLLIDREAKAENVVNTPLEARLFGIYPVGQVYPVHYIFTEPQDVEFIDGQIKDKHRKTLREAASSLSEIMGDMPAIDELDKLVIGRFQTHRRKYKNDSTLKKNFELPAVTVEQYLDMLADPEMRKTLIDDPLKFRTLIISMFVASFNTPKDKK